MKPVPRITRVSASVSGRVLVRALLALCALSALSLQVCAQTLYKIVGPDGRITYSDQPPASTSGQVTALGADARVPAKVVGAASAAADAASTPGAGAPKAAAGSGERPPGALPPDLREQARRYPVTLYAGSECPPCDAGRRLLGQRGIPFTERTVDHDDDVDAMSRITGGRTLPALTVGKQALRGYSESDWTEYLDAAGYPRESRLPRNYQAPTPIPLVARRPDPAPAARPETAAADRLRPLAPPPPEPDPSGIRF
jgi:glutaredoxin